MDRVGKGLFDRELYAIEVSIPSDVPTAISLPCPYFACLIAWDARDASDEDIEMVANRLLSAGCVYVCCWGPDCERVHDHFDIAEMGVRADGPWAMSTWHENEPLSEALWFLLFVTMPDDAYFDDCRASIGLTIGSPSWAAEVRSAFSSPSEFSASVLASEEPN